MKKYKLKTHKATAKRFKLTPTGKVIRKRIQKRDNDHLKSKKSRSQKKTIQARYVLSSRGTVRKIKKLLNV